MSFWDETVSTAKDVIEIAAQKTEQVVEVQKKRFAVQKQKNKVAKSFETLGRSYFDSVNGDESSAGLLESLCEQVEADLKELSKLKKELADLKNQE